MSSKGKFSLAAIVGSAFLAGILFATAGANLFGAGDAVGTSTQAATLDGSTAVQAASQESTASPADMQTAFTEVAESVNPAVVQIRSQQVVERRQMPNPFRGTPFEDFFGRPDDSEPEQRQGLGSGVVVQSDGYIVTNYHVVENADQLSVVMMDGTNYEAEIVGTDPYSDLAVLKIEDSNLTAVSFGDSDRLKTGEWVLAFGSPLSQELNNTVTAGIVSAVGRLNPTAGQGVANFVQTDAAINRGNSGGPLVNLDGRLVGINTAIASTSGGYQGIGFAIPSNTVERVATQIIEQGNVQRAYLGIGYDPAPESLVKNEDLPQGSVIIRTVSEGSAAAEAGLQSGDVVTAVNGEPLQKPLQIANLIASQQPGDEVSITVVKRSGEQQTLDVTLGSRSEGMTASSGGGGSPEDDGRPFEEQLQEELGLSIRDVTPAIAQRLGLDDAEGVVIADVDRSNPIARNSGLQRGQVIVEMAGTQITGMDTFQEVYSQVEPGQAFRVLVRSPQGYMSVTSLRKPADNG